MSHLDDDTIIGEDDGPQGVGYGSIQGLAVPTLVLGLLSFLALFKTTFWVFPLVAVVLGVVSLRKLAANPEQFGRRAVVIGITLAILFGLWGPARYFSRQQWLAAQAREYADAWLKLIHENKLREAHQLHMPRPQRADEGVSLDEYYAKVMYAKSGFDTFFEAEPLKTITTPGGDQTLVFKCLEDYVEDTYTDTITLRYILRCQKKGREEVVPVLIVMIRTADLKAGDQSWCVQEIRIAS